MLEKLVQLKNRQLNTLFVKPTQLKSTDVYLVFLHEALGSIHQWRDFPVQVCQVFTQNH
jgi:hypothetical protein